MIQIGDGYATQHSHFYMIAIQCADRVVDVAGTLDPPRKATRLDVLNLIRGELEKRIPECRGGAVVAFDVQPNRL